jgi:hypothetical protein
MTGMKGARTLFVLTIAGAAWTSGAYAHGGGLNAEGCHNNRKTGDYHCHRAPAASRPQASPYGNTLAPRNNFNGSSGAFRNCAEARAAGAAPVRRGDPGYGPHLDRDNDGIGCE